MLEGDKWAETVDVQELDKSPRQFISDFFEFDYR